MSEEAKQGEQSPAKPHPRLRLSDRIEVVEDFQRLLAIREKNSGEVLFQGSWTTPDAAMKSFRRQMLFGRLRVIELIAVTLLLLLSTLFPFAFLAVLGGIAR